MWMFAIGIRYASSRSQRTALLIAVCLSAGYASAASDPAEHKFVQQLVSAINGSDQSARKALMHPDALKCDEALKQSMAEGAFVPKQGPIPAGYRWRISPMPAGPAGWFADKFDYPVIPTH